MKQQVIDILMERVSKIDQKLLVEPSTHERVLLLERKSELLGSMLDVLKIKEVI